MENIQEKKLSLQISFNFVEELITKYKLEDDFISHNLALSKSLDSLNNSNQDYFIERAVAKSIYNKGCYLEPTLSLRKILSDLINKQLNFSSLAITLQGDLGISPELSVQIAEEIKNNPQVIKEIESDFVDELTEKDFFSYVAELNQISSVDEIKNKPKGLSQDLL